MVGPLCVALPMLLLAGSVRGATVTYTFDVTQFSADPFGTGQAEQIAGINGGLVGPTIDVVQGDRLVIAVANHLDIPMTFHCHGLEFRTENWLDGVTGVTQCAINPNTSFTYDFLVDDYPGTYWYHPHVDLHNLGAIDAMHGPLIIRPGAGRSEIHASLYDQESTLFFMDWGGDTEANLYWAARGGLLLPQRRDSDGNSLNVFPFNGMLLNGAPAGPSSPFIDLSGEVGHRLRIVNGGWSEAFQICIDGHSFDVVQTDGADTEPYSVDCIQMYPAERYDVIVVRNPTPDAVWVRLHVLGGPELTIPARFGSASTALPATSAISHPSVLNCVVNRVDIGVQRCLPVTALKRHAGARDVYEHATGISMAGYDQGSVAQQVRVDARFSGTVPGCSMGVRFHGVSTAPCRRTVMESQEGRETLPPHFPERGREGREGGRKGAGLSKLRVRLTGRYCLPRSTPARAALRLVPPLHSCRATRCSFRPLYQDKWKH